MSIAIGRDRGPYPPVQNGKEKRPGLMSPGDFARIPTGAALPITYNNGVIAITPATGAQNGYLAAADYTALQLLADPVRARVYRNTNQSIANATATAISFGATRVNTAGAAGGASPWQGGNPTRLTATIAGWYAIGGGFIFANTAGGTLRQGAIRLNGATDLLYDGTPNPAGAYLPLLGLATVYQLAAGDYVELMANQDSGGAVNVVTAGNYSPELWFVRLCA